MKPLRVFILDDDVDSSMCLSVYLQRIDGVKLAGIGNDPGKAIYDIIEANPDLLLLDIEMPGMSGFDAISILKSENCNPTIIVVSSYFQYAIKGIRERVADYLLKPVDFADFKACILKFISKYKDQTRKKIPELPEIERKVAQGMFQGKTSSEIGDQLCLSPHTVDKYRGAILKKTGMKSTFELISNFYFH